MQIVTNCPYTKILKFYKNRSFDQKKKCTYCPVTEACCSHWYFSLIQITKLYRQVELETSTKKTGLSTDHKASRSRKNNTQVLAQNTCFKNHYNPWTCSSTEVVNKLTSSVLLTQNQRRQVCHSNISFVVNCCKSLKSLFVTFKVFMVSP